GGQIPTRRARGDSSQNARKRAISTIRRTVTGALGATAKRIRIQRALTTTGALTGGALTRARVRPLTVGALTRIRVRPLTVGALTRARIRPLTITRIGEDVGQRTEVGVAGVRPGGQIPTRRARGDSSQNARKRAISTIRRTVTGALGATAKRIRIQRALTTTGALTGGALTRARVRPLTAGALTRARIRPLTITR